MCLLLSNAGPLQIVHFYASISKCKGAVSYNKIKEKLLKLCVCCELDYNLPKTMVKS